MNVSLAVRPTYILTAQNFTFRSANELVFDIYILHTNPADTVFQFALGQYYFNFDTMFCAGGTIRYDYAPGNIGDSSDFPFAARPRGPTRVGSTLRVNSNTVLGLGNGPIVSGVAPGSKIIRMRLRTTAVAFSSNKLSDLHLKWRNSNAGNPYVKIFGYIGGTATEMTDSTKHFIESISLNLKIIPEGIYYDLFNQLTRRDTMTVYLRNTTSPYTKVDSAKAVIDSVNFSGFFKYWYAPAGTYYIAINHFNTLETWSKSGGVMNLSDTAFYDFTTDALQAYGNNLKLKGSKYCAYSGDINQDGIIDASDLIKVYNDSYVGLTGRYIVSDLNGDSVVDASDISITDNNVYIGVLRITP
ncbi:MAG: hypothetical protein IPG78_08790 [Ignavibacteria bacterium]|nr:hypothetical protein [Ignavibacteria bacterium]